MIAIDGIGVFTSVGLNVPQAMGSLRTGIERFAESQFFGGDGQPIVTSSTPVASDGLLDSERLVAMGSFALAECARGHEQEPAPVLLCMPEPDETSVSAEVIFRGLSQHASVALDPANSGAFPLGHAGIGPALARARELLSTGKVAACYVGGVDSLVQRGRLEHLNRHDRVKHADQSDGLIPGEGAAFLRLTRTTSRETLAVVRGIGVAQEAATRRSGEPMQGLGMTQAIRAAFSDARANIGHVSMLATDISGERYGFHEMALAIIRLRPPGSGNIPRWNPAESVGDIGAAVGPLALAYLAFMSRAGGAPGPGLLFTAGAEQGTRSAVLLWEVDPG